MFFFLFFSSPFAFLCSGTLNIQFLYEVRLKGFCFPLFVGVGFRNQ